jgi:hypothetical protein
MAHGDLAVVEALWLLSHKTLLSFTDTKDSNVDPR